jgi:threonine synthase
MFRGGDQNSLVNQLVKRGDWFPATVVCPRDGFANPYGVEGFKTIAFEIFEQLGNRPPDRVFAPVGSGDGMYGIWKGFDELYRLGVAPSRPAMFACQAEGADVYVRAVRSGSRKLTALNSVSTVALSIAERIGSELTLGAIYESRGDAIAVPDEAMLAASRQMGRQGFALEPASASSIACARTVAHHATPGEIWVAIGTGAATKWPHNLTRDFEMPEAQPDDFADIDCLIPG